MIAEAVVTALQGREAYEWRDFVGSLSQLAMNTAAKLRLDVLVIASAGALWPDQWNSSRV